MRHQRQDDANKYLSAQARVQRLFRSAEAPLTNQLTGTGKVRWGEFMGRDHVLKASHWLTGGGMFPKAE